MFDEGLSISIKTYKRDKMLKKKGIPNMTYQKSLKKVFSKNDFFRKKF